MHKMIHILFLSLPCIKMAFSDIDYTNINMTTTTTTQKLNDTHENFSFSFYVLFYVALNTTECV